MSQSNVYPVTSSIIYTKKKKQIESLRLFSNDVREIHPGAEYHLTFFSGIQELTLKIQLPPDYPSQPPAISISPCIEHNWIADRGRVLSPGLVNYSEQSDLGQIVHAIIREMKKSPEATILGHHMNNGVKSDKSLPFPSQLSQQQYFPIPPFIPELESLSRSHLKNLNENEDFLHQFVDELPQSSTMAADVETLLNTVEGFAKGLNDTKEAINGKRQKLVEHFETLNKLKQEWDSLSAQHQSLSQRYLPSNIEESLQQAAALAEDKSEGIAEVFLSGQMDVESFLSSYTVSRTVSHLRKTKEEILHKQLQELQRLGY